MSAKWKGNSVSDKYLIPKKQFEVSSSEVSCEDMLGVVSPTMKPRTTDAHYIQGKDFIYQIFKIFWQISRVTFIVKMRNL